jgi:hypothetical protein
VKDFRFPGLLSSLADIPGAHTETHQTVRFEVHLIEEAMDSIRRLQGTGQLTIHFHNGKANGLAQWISAFRPETS